MQLGTKQRVELLKELNALDPVEAQKALNFIRQKRSEAEKKKDDVFTKRVNMEVGNVLTQKVAQARKEWGRERIIAGVRNPGTQIKIMYQGKKYLAISLDKPPGAFKTADDLMNLDAVIPIGAIEEGRKRKGQVLNPRTINAGAIRAGWNVRQGLTAAEIKSFEQEGISYGQPLAGRMLKIAKNWFKRSEKEVIKVDKKGQIVGKIWILQVENKEHKYEVRRYGKNRKLQETRIRSSRGLFLNLGDAHDMMIYLAKKN